MSTFVFLIIFSASVLFAHAIVMRKFPDLNDPKNIFKEQSRIRSKAFDDSSCDKQLKLFSDAFTSREAWALQCKVFGDLCNCDLIQINSSR